MENSSRPERDGSSQVDHIARRDNTISIFAWCELRRLPGFPESVCVKTATSASIEKIF